MEKFYLNFRYPLFCLRIVLVPIFLFGTIFSTFATNLDTKKLDSLSAICLFPAYTTRNTDVTSPSQSDGKLLITNINNATHYEILEGNNTPFDFNQATVIPAKQNEIEIKNISNPTGLKNYRVRLYNGDASCYSDQNIVFEHINFAANRDYVKLELLQAVDNSTPRLGDIVTFTTIIQNKGNRQAENVEVRVILNSSLEIVSNYNEKGQFSSIGNIWKIGSIEGGRSIKLVVRTKVKSQGLSYYTSYISEEGLEKFNFAQAQSFGNETDKRSGTSCVTVPIDIKSDEVYNIVLKQYKGVKWYYKDASGNFLEINDKTNPALAVINPDSTLTIKQSGEFSFSKKVGDCNISSCCPIIVESCAGPNIVVDSVYCSTIVDSYTIQVHLENDNFSIIEKVFFAMANLNFPVLTNYLERINALPITSSSGFVTSLGNSVYLIENIPAFMPNVTLVSSDLTGKCRNIRIVNAPNCTGKSLGIPQPNETVMYISEGEPAPSFVVAKKEKGVEVIWFADDLGQKVIHKGKRFKPKKAGDYYVAYKESKTNTIGVLKKVQMIQIQSEIAGKFIAENVCGCDNPLMVPQGDLGELSTAKAYPNPVSDLLTVEYRLPKSATKAEVNFLNISGKLMKNIELNKNSSFINVETLKWADGTYFYSLIIDGKKSMSQKIIVSHN